MKCLPQEKIGLVKGNVLHDWHAEVLAIRGFNRWLIDECEEAVKGNGVDLGWVRWREEGRRKHGAADGQEQDLATYEQPFTLDPDVRIHMYCSEAPCGDASMELTMAEQEDATPWTSQTPGMPGRGNFDQLGVVRRKPARPDAPICMSKSCSDKLALKQCTGLLSGLTSLLLHPGNLYLETLVLPESQCVPKAVERAFGAKGRMGVLADREVQERWQRSGFAFKPFEVRTTKREFAFSKRAVEGAVPSNLSALYTPHRREALINGVLQGRKLFDPRGASCVSRRMMWKSVLQLAVAAGVPALSNVLGKRKYAEVKEGEIFEKRQKVKREAKEMALKGWKRNEGDENWGLEDD